MVPLEVLLSFVLPITDIPNQMAKFLNTRKAVAEIEDLIRSAQEKLTLVSPYLKLSKDFKELLTYRNGKDKITTVIFGKQELKPEEMRFLQSLRFVILKFHEDLHAKCYLNEKKMIITSLNLYQFSMANNKEMGVLIDLDDEADKALYEEAYNEIEFIESTSVRFDFTSNSYQTEEVTPIEVKKVDSFESKGAGSPKSSTGVKYLSTTAIAKELGLSGKDVFAVMEQSGFIIRNGKSWELTKFGEQAGGQIKNGKYGEFIGWPEEFVQQLLSIISTKMK